MMIESNLSIRQAIPQDSKVLTDISRNDKDIIQYPKEGCIIWEGELVMTESFIRENCVLVAEVEGEIIGYSAVVDVEKECNIGRAELAEGYWLSHLFVRPEYIKRGVGKHLVEAASRYCKEKGRLHINILTGECAKGFYNRIGAKYYGEAPSKRKEQTVAIYELDIY